MATAVGVAAGAGAGAGHGRQQRPGAGSGHGAAGPGTARNGQYGFDGAAQCRRGRADRRAAAGFWRTHARRNVADICAFVPGSGRAGRTRPGRRIGAARAEPGAARGHDGRGQRGVELFVSGPGQVLAGRAVQPRRFRDRNTRAALPARAGVGAGDRRAGDRGHGHTVAQLGGRIAAAADHCRLCPAACASEVSRSGQFLAEWNLRRLAGV